MSITSRRNNRLNMRRRTSPAIPNVVYGGFAEPLFSDGRYTYSLMHGQTHEQGSPGRTGIGIGKDLEVQRNEIVATPNKGSRAKSIKVYSNENMDGKSPARRVLDGENPDVAFKRQQRWKQVNGYNDDGTKKARRGKRQPLREDLELNPDIDFMPPGDERKISFMNALTENYHKMQNGMNLSRIDQISELAHDLSESRFHNDLYKRISADAYALIPYERQGKYLNSAFGFMSGTDKDYGFAAGDAKKGNANTLALLRGRGLRGVPVYRAKADALSPEEISQLTLLGRGRAGENIATDNMTITLNGSMNTGSKDRYVLTNPNTGDIIGLNGNNRRIYRSVDNAFWNPDNYEGGGRDKYILRDPGIFSYGLFSHPNGKFYARGDDYNDHYAPGRVAEYDDDGNPIIIEYPLWKQWGLLALDNMFNYPFVQSTGYQEVPELEGYNVAKVGPQVTVTPNGIRESTNNDINLAEDLDDEYYYKLGGRKKAEFGTDDLGNGVLGLQVGKQVRDIQNQPDPLLSSQVSPGGILLKMGKISMDDMFPKVKEFKNRFDFSTEQPDVLRTNKPFLPILNVPISDMLNKSQIINNEEDENLDFGSYHYNHNVSDDFITKREEAFNNSIMKHIDVLDAIYDTVTRLGYPEDLAYAMAGTAAGEDERLEGRKQIGGPAKGYFQKEDAVQKEYNEFKVRYYRNPENKNRKEIECETEFMLSLIDKEKTAYDRAKELSDFWGDYSKGNITPYIENKYPTMLDLLSQNLYKNVTTKQARSAILNGNLDERVTGITQLLERPRKPRLAWRVHYARLYRDYRNSKK